MEAEMNLLKREIHEMWTLVYKQIFRAGEAVLTLDKNIAQQIMISERRVNVYELKIDNDVEDVLAMCNPVAIDLRFVLAISKINTNLERIADFAEGIARFINKYPEPGLDSELIKDLRLSEMIEEVKSMLLKTQEAFEKENTEIEILDKTVNEILADYIKKNPDSALSCLYLVGVFRKFERAGDHISNIAEEIVFSVDAKVLKHSKSIEEEQK